MARASGNWSGPSQPGWRTWLERAGATTLGQLAALYERCALVLGSDSGPLHLAVAVGAPSVHLYGPVPPAKFGPWGDPTRQVVLRRLVLRALRPARLAGRCSGATCVHGCDPAR